MPSTIENAEDLLEAATTAEHISLGKDLDKDEKYVIIKQMNGHRGKANNMEGDEHVTHTRCKHNNDAYADAADAYDVEDEFGGKVKHMAAAAATHNEKEIDEGTSKGNKLPPLGNQFIAAWADEHGVPPLCVPYIKSIGGFDCDFEGKEEGENYFLD